MTRLPAIVANPWVLWLLLAMPVLGVAQFLAAYRSRLLLRRLGDAMTLSNLMPRPRRFAWVSAFLVSSAMTALVAGAAGPRWGFDERPAIVPGRDLIILLDMSRSMRATDAPPNRFARAVESIQALADYCRQRGGHRLALVVFASDAQIVCPLTHDYDHIQMKVNALDLDHPPPGLRPNAGSASGTRIGAGLRMALAAQDDAQMGYVDIVLLSDGDDPLNDGEWEHGLRAVETAKVPVYTIGVGDPTRDSEIAVPGRDRPATTRLVEQPLRTIASRTGGQYVRAGTDMPRLDDLFRRAIEPRGAGLPRGEAPVLAQPRQAWFYAASLALFGLAGLVQLTRSRNNGSKKQK